jgi:hypothetical protein
MTLAVIMQPFPVTWQEQAISPRRIGPHEPMNEP